MFGDSSHRQTGMLLPEFHSRVRGGKTPWPCYHQPAGPDLDMPRAAGICESGQCWIVLIIIGAGICRSKIKACPGAKHCLLPILSDLINIPGLSRKLQLHNYIFHSSNHIQ